MIGGEPFPTPSPLLLLRNETWMKVEKREFFRVDGAPVAMKANVFSLMKNNGPEGRKLK